MSATKAAVFDWVNKQVDIFNADTELEREIATETKATDGLYHDYVKTFIQEVIPIKGGKWRLSRKFLQCDGFQSDIPPMAELQKKEGELPKAAGFDFPGSAERWVELMWFDTSCEPIIPYVVKYACKSGNAEAAVYKFYKKFSGTMPMVRGLLYGNRYGGPKCYTPEVIKKLFGPYDENPQFHSKY